MGPIKKNYYKRGFPSHHTIKYIGIFIRMKCFLKYWSYIVDFSICKYAGLGNFVRMYGEDEKM